MISRLIINIYLPCQYIQTKQIKMEKKLTLLIAFFICIVSMSAQLIYSVDSEWQADVKVYVVSSEWQADLSVYKVGSSWKAKGNEGKWFFVDSEWQADKKVYFVDSEWQADLTIYFVSSEWQAEWNDKSKIPLMY